MNLYVSIILLVVYLSGCGFLTPKEISIAQLIADYQENEFDARTKYRGQTLTFTATVSHFEDSDEFIRVDLEDGRVSCFTDKSSQPDAYSKLAYSKLKRGEIRTFKGVVSKETITLTECEIK